MLVSTLVAFKRMHDDNVLLHQTIPKCVAARSTRCRGVRLRDRCAEMHAFFRSHNVSALQRAQLTAPYEAARYLVCSNVDYLPIDEIEVALPSRFS
jgi:ornithine decarboxylase